MMYVLRTLFVLLISFSFMSLKAQIKDSVLQLKSDTIFLMNGNVVGEPVIDSSLGAITISDSKKPGKKIHYEWDELYMVKFANGNNRYYYQQDTTKNNWFTREEMWLYMKGEKDAHRGFKPKACAITAGFAGLIGGMSGTFWAPVAPYGFMALSGITKIKIRHGSVSDPRYVDYDGYILGYQRVGRQKRKIWSVIGGSIGLAAGYALYFVLKDYYPTGYQNGKFVYN